MLRAFQTAIAAKNAVFSRGYLLAKLKTGAAALKRPLFSFFAMFFLMRTEVAGGIYPLAPAFLAAGLAAGIHPAALCAGCMAGMVRFPLHTSALIPAIACALSLLGELALSFFRTKQPAPEIRCAVLSGACVMLPALVFAGGEMLPSLQAVSAGAIAAAASPFFMCALKIGKKHRRLMLQEKTGVFLLLASFTGGAYALSPALAAFIGTLAALVLHPMGAVTGVICGLGHLLGGAGPAALALPAVSGLISGWNILRARWQRSLCIFSVAVLAFFTSWIPPIGILGSLAACILYALLPGRFTEAASILYACPDGNDPDRMARDICEESRMRLTALAEAFGEMAESCTATENLPDEQSLISEMRSRLCSGCAEYPACWNGCDNHAAHFLCALIGEALERVEAPAGMRVIYSDGEIPPEIMRFCRRGRMIPDRLGLLLRDFAEKRRSIIKRSMTNRSLHMQFAQARELIYAMADKQAAPVQLRGGQLEKLETVLEEAGIAGCEVSASDIKTLEIRLARTSGEWTPEEARIASRAFAQVFGGGFSPYRRGNVLCFTRRPRFRVQTGASCCAGKAGEVCGDSHLMRMMGPHRLAALLSDGMGSGESAARESSAALRMLWRLLNAGISRPLAIETVNQHMLMRTGDDIYATIDLAIIDLNTGVMELSKLAACRTIILRGGEVLSLEGGNLPLGILERVQPDTKCVKLRDGDTIIIASDGVMDSCDAPSMDRFLRAHAASSPDVIAEETVREAALRRGNGRSDDMTCICIRIIESKTRHKKPAHAR